MSILRLFVSLFCITFLTACEVRSIPKAGDIPPRFTTIGITGEKLVLDDMRGKGVVLRFWQSSCASCLKEMPLLESIAQKSGEKIHIIAINVGEPHAHVERFLNENPVALSVISDEGRSISDSYGILATPATFFINPSGILTDVLYGESDALSLEKRVQNILNKKEK
ncbi:MAG: TlpA family protein disulfide reductase [Wolinella sp.]